MSDLQLRQDVLDELEFEPSVKASHIGVAVDKGVVTLSGRRFALYQNSPISSSTHRKTAS